MNRRQLVVSYGVGLLMLALALAYFVAPELIEQLYGVAVPEQGKYSMHYAVGVRDLFYGLLILTLTLLKQQRSLSIAIGLGMVLPLGDATIVLFYEKAGLLRALPHLGGVVMLLVVFLYLKK
ncbi:DUF4267 domain-containing protein [Spirosoma soli]|uniref:DUF4267 domain-containing protein n=1 Tax=Spirosoma soli TaxID=1770529 RepID=A0ABW5MBX1_9BACT